MGIGPIVTLLRGRYKVYSKRINLHVCGTRVMCYLVSLSSKFCTVHVYAMRLHGTDV